MNWSRPFFILLLFGFSSGMGGCSVLATRPTQEMSYTTVAIRAAKEVNADVLAPELYRQANEWFYKAKAEYRFKNFDLASKYARKARGYAEESEFESIRAGASRTEPQIADPMAPAQPPSP